MTAAPALPPSLQANARLSTWLRIDPGGYVEVRSGKVEIGQGILTALAQIVAEELDVAFGRIRMVAADTALSPDEAVTSGSLSIQHSGSALRHACAQARALMLAKVARQEGVPVAALTVVDGVIQHEGRGLASYWSLADDGLLDCAAQPGVAPKGRDGYQVVGTTQARPDIAQKVFGEFRFIHDLVLPAMAHGRMVRPPSPGAEFLEWDADTVSRWPGVIAVVRDGSLAGVVAETEALAERAAGALARSARWRERATLPDMDDLPAWLKTLRCGHGSTPLSRRPAEDLPRRLYQTLHQARLDRPVLRAGPGHRRQPGSLEPHARHLQPAQGPEPGLRTAGSRHRRAARARRGLLWPQWGRRRRLRCRLAGPPMPGKADPRAVVAHGRTELVAARPGDGDRTDRRRRSGRPHRSVAP
jgi:nicotinate dehydrogenase subunit B